MFTNANKESNYRGHMLPVNGVGASALMDNRAQLVSIGEKYLSQPVMQMKGKYLNDNRTLEKGGKAIQMKRVQSAVSQNASSITNSDAPIQFAWRDILPGAGKGAMALGGALSLPGRMLMNASRVHGGESALMTGVKYAGTFAGGLLAGVGGLLGGLFGGIGGAVAGGVAGYGRPAHAYAMLPAAPAPVPSATFANNLNVDPAFHNLPHDRLPAVPDGYHWTGGGHAGNYIPMRNPLLRAASARFDVTTRNVGGRLVYSSHEADPGLVAPHRRRVLSAYAETAPRGNTYPGARNYPMSVHDYTDPATGTVYGRGHAVDHADGDAASTADPENYVPENDDFNQGARDHLVQNLRRRGGGYYRATYQYPAHPGRTNDESAIPSREHFEVVPNAAAHPARYFDVPMQGYPADRHLAAGDQYEQAYANAPRAPWQ